MFITLLVIQILLWGGLVCHIPGLYHIVMAIMAIVMLPELILGKCIEAGGGMLAIALLLLIIFGINIYAIFTLGIIGFISLVLYIAGLIIGGYVHSGNIY